MNLAEVLRTMPLIAVLRYIQPDEVVAIGQALIQSGLVCLEVTMNSPNPCDSMRKLLDAFGEKVLVAAGTVTEVKQVQAVAEAGAKVIIMPHSDSRIIQESKRLGLCCIPGIATPTEAYAAIHAGADALKLFPAISIAPSVVKAFRAVLPMDIALIPTGGITPDRIEAYLKAGANGFGLGSALYQPGDSPARVIEKAKTFIDEINRIRND